MRSWEPLAALFAFEPGEGLASRVYRLTTLIGAIACLGVMAPINLLLGLTPALNALVAAFGLACVGLHRLGRRGRQVPALLCFLVVALLNATWFLAAGSHGSAVMWFYFATVLLTIFFRGRRLVAALTLLVLDGVALYWIDAQRPQLILPYASETERFADLATGFPVSVLTTALVGWGLLEAYGREHLRLREANGALERSLAEVKSLRGLLQVCSWCQRIRDDPHGWRDLAGYVAERTEASLTHGICPDCAARHFPEA